MKVTSADGTYLHMKTNSFNLTGSSDCSPISERLSVYSLGADGELLCADKLILLGTTIFLTLVDFSV